MIQFAKTDTEVRVLLTLTELQTQASPDYFFSFHHVATKEVVTLLIPNAQDNSQYKARYNEFTVNPSQLFSGKPAGEWHYTVRENNADGEILEHGKLLLHKNDLFRFVKHNEATGFKTYNG